MIIRNVTRQDLEKALETVTARYDGNVIWNRAPEPLNARGTAWRCTLRVKDSHGPGARLSPSYQRRHTVAACWHAHGVFFDALPAQAVIVTGSTKTRPGAPWHDWNAGSYLSPAYMSELCEC